MYAIVEAGGRQWKVEPGTQFDINRPGEGLAVGTTHTLERILLAHDGQQAQVGRPYVDGATVVCEVLAHKLGPKTISYHFRRRENWRKTVGHRQPLTRLLVKEILWGAPAAGEGPAAVAVEHPAAKTGAVKKAAARATPAKSRPQPRKKAARDGA